MWEATTLVVNNTHGTVATGAADGKVFGANHCVPGCAGYVHVAAGCVVCVVLGANGTVPAVGGAI